jgi:histone acetyltransferase (RNA polymerase elongator complex component)
LSSKSNRRDLIIPVFIPFLGCQHKCIYCRQDRITGQINSHVLAEDVTGLIEQAILSPKYKTACSREVAFYGGTFTRLGSEYMSELLGAVEPYIKENVIDSIRISTRPDEIDENRLELLRSYGVTTVELGVQSMDNDVLRKSGRGHTAEHTVNAISLLKRYGLKTGVQLLPGLPGDSYDIFQETIEKIIELAPDMARIYPAIVIRDTGLAMLYNAGKYRPLSLDEAVRVCSVNCARLEENSINVIRIGLMSTPSLLKEGEILAGPWHNAFGFLVRADIYMNKIMPFLPAPGTASIIGIRIPEREIPLLRGYENKGFKKIEEICAAKIRYIRPENSIPSGRIEVDILEKDA